MFNGTIAISENPTTQQDKYHLNLIPSDEISIQGFEKIDFSNQAEGGFNRCKFVLNGDAAFLQSALTDLLGRFIIVYDPNGISCWEGMIDEAELHTGPTDLRNSLGEIANKIWVRYRVQGASETVRSTVYTDTDSIDRYGEYQFVLSAGELTSSDIANQAAQRYLYEHAWPSISAQIQTGGGEDIAFQGEVRASGLWGTLNQKVYNQTAATDTTDLSSLVASVIAEVGQFVLSNRIETNATVVSKEFDADRRGGDIVRDLSRLGDSNYFRWLAYMTNNRKFVFERAAAPRIIG